MKYHSYAIYAKGKLLKKFVMSLFHFPQLSSQIQGWTQFPMGSEKNQSSPNNLTAQSTNKQCSCFRNVNLNKNGKKVPSKQQIT